MKWKDKLISDLLAMIKTNSSWSSLFKKEINEGLVNIHLAIFNEPFLEMMYKGKKTIESRFSMNNVIPYNRIFPGDLVLVKRSGGDIEAIFIAKEVQYFRNLKMEKIKKLQKSIGRNIGWDIDPEFLSNKSHAKYLTLIEISSLTKMTQVTCGKKDKTGWSIVKVGDKNTLFDS